MDGWSDGSMTCGEEDENFLPFGDDDDSESDVAEDTKEAVFETEPTMEPSDDVIKELWKEFEKYEADPG
jgi:hypothetical protein